MSSSSNTEATIKLDKAVYSLLCLMKLSCEMLTDKQSHMLVEIIKELLVNKKIRTVLVTQEGQVQALFTTGSNSLQELGSGSWCGKGRR